MKIQKYKSDISKSLGIVLDYSGDFVYALGGDVYKFALNIRVHRHNIVIYFWRRSK